MKDKKRIIQVTTTMERKGLLRRIFSRLRKSVSTVRLSNSSPSYDHTPPPITVSVTRPRATNLATVRPPRYTPRCLRAVNASSVLNGAELPEDFSEDCWLQENLHHFGDLRNRNIIPAVLSQGIQSSQSETTPNVYVVNECQSLPLGVNEERENVTNSSSSADDGNAFDLDRSFDTRYREEGTGAGGLSVSEVLDALDSSIMLFSAEQPPAYSDLEDQPCDSPPSYSELFGTASRNSCWSDAMNNNNADSYLY